MSIEIIEAEWDELDAWDDYVERSPMANVFHQSDALRIQERHSNSTLHPLVGKKGQEVVGIFPVFQKEKGPFSGVFSPPPPLWVPRLGPALLNVDDLRQRKLESTANGFIEGCNSWIRENLQRNYMQVRTEAALTDVRPFKWDGGDVTPEYTYVLDITPDEDDLLMRFTSDARKNIRNVDTDEHDFTVEEGGVEEVKRILRQVTERYEEQGEGFNMPTEFAVDLYESLPEGQIRPYVFRYEGTYVSGMLTYEYKDRVFRWHGGVRPDIDVGLSVNELLDWHIIRDAKSRGVTHYDLVGAGNARLNLYKTKYNPDLELFFSVRSGSRGMKTVVDLYRNVL
ncbi:GNAT family N-acetyltransferase [Haloferax sp. MBLA0076]|uniref:GNAT family N-acetyltransferase n=1 Tax=Haloferax litoreum TaxID=2666140 RepID=A0A6A8GLA2_9EURY|nr:MULTISPECIES: GNAT family N-acetyltransferase [Haloferax]KAB1189929.1 GNAT family N-acetyltransferase [Haloferax sp. CBA1148]MRX23699.1 GNAT family N-acetyltransferase [Haloferax litoreum]